MSDLDLDDFDYEPPVRKTADPVVTYLLKKGPQLSGVVARHLEVSLNISNEAARQRVQRSKKEVRRADTITFPKKAQFLYLPEQFASQRYWDNLIDALRDNKTAYGLAIVAMLAHGGVIEERLFPIVCGAPERQKKHLSATTIKDRLIQVGLLELIIEGGKSYISVRRNINKTRIEYIPNLKSRMFVENIVIDYLSAWMKNLGIISFDSIKTRRDDVLPTVGRLSWDITAPTYLHPMLRVLKDGPREPGFVACDILLDNVNYDAARVFLHKCSLLRSSRNINCMQMLVANRFDKSAFQILKAGGVIPATIGNLFGRKVAKSIEALPQLIVESFNEGVDVEKLDTLLNSMAEFEGKFGQLRGDLFEFLVAQAVRKTTADGMIYMNYSLRSGGKSAEVDIISYSRGGGIRFIECKGKNQYLPLPDKDIERWVGHTMPIVFEYISQHPEWKKEKITFELWTTAKLSKIGNDMIEGAASKFERKFNILVKRPADILSEFENLKDRALINCITNHYIAKSKKKSS